MNSGKNAFLLQLAFVIVQDYQGVATYVFTSKNKSLQGPYYTTVDDFSACKGPKTVDSAHFATNLTKVGHSYVGFLDVTILADTFLDKVLFKLMSKYPYALDFVLKTE